MGVGLLLASTTSCTIPTLSLEGRPCPCAAGWVCDPPTAICTRPLPVDGGVQGDGGGISPDWCALERPDALFCRDFITPLAGYTRLVVSADTTLAATNDHGFETRGALDARIGASPGGGVVIMPLDPVGLSTEIFIRAHVFIPDSAVIDSDVGLFAIHGETDMDTQALVAAVLADDSIAAGAFTPSFVSVNDPSRPFPRERWVCVEMRALVENEPYGELELFVDGESWDLATGIDTYPGEDFTLVSAGIYHSSLPPPFEVRIDRLVVDDQPVGCP